ncbi:hypothetical protein F2P56_011049 [Juglans regia]|uniref:No apical meristem-associated C-terminal domain-containing protein n=1 Tax=Juglans regia TaxID=51240 RepID=A0A834CXD9_JUGRE|nr:hypothetical protein F2P56_011049 [Juglans regia]
MADSLSKEKAKGKLRIRRREKKKWLKTEALTFKPEAFFNPRDAFFNPRDAFVFFKHETPSLRRPAGVFQPKRVCAELCHKVALPVNPRPKIAHFLYKLNFKIAIGIEKAKMLYKEMVGSNFTMEHCWCLLRHQPKWQQHISTFGKKRKPQEKYVGEVDVDLAEEDLEVLTERPPGKKAEKERERKRKSMEGKEVEIKTALAKMTEDRATTMEERRNAMIRSLILDVHLHLRRRLMEVSNF